MPNKYLEKIAAIVQETQASADVTPTQPGPNSFPERGQSSEDEEANEQLGLQQTNQLPEEEQTDPIIEPIRLSHKILRHIADTYGPERDPEHEEKFDPIAFIQEIKANKAIQDAEQVNDLDPSRSAEGPQGSSSEVGISNTSLSY